MMITVALVEDSAFDRKILVDLLSKYASENSVDFSIREYPDGQAFLNNCKDTPDVIFMDIVMEKSDGIRTAHQLRISNSKSLLIFVTTMIQYAVQGYSVDAMDFLVKPVNYLLFKLCMDRVQKKLRQNEPVRLTFSNREGSWSVPADELCYVESLDHKVYVHTIEKVIAVDISLTAVEKMCASLPFFRCHVSFLVNLAFVERVSGNDVWVHGSRLSISRYRRREFLDVWAAYAGG